MKDSCSLQFSGTLDGANSMLQSRLRHWLQEAKTYDGETMHSFRAGVAITLALSGSQLSDIMEHTGCRHAPTASHYLKVVQVLRPGGPSGLLFRNVSSATTLVAFYSDFKVGLHMKTHHFFKLFPWLRFNFKPWQGIHL